MAGTNGPSTRTNQAAAGDWYGSLAFAPLGYPEPWIVGNDPWVGLTLGLAAAVAASTAVATVTSIDSAPSVGAVAQNAAAAISAALSIDPADAPGAVAQAFAPPASVVAAIAPTVSAGVAAQNVAAALAPAVALTDGMVMGQVSQDAAHASASVGAVSPTIVLGLVAQAAAAFVAAAAATSPGVAIGGSVEGADPEIVMGTSVDDTVAAGPTAQDVPSPTTFTVAIAPTGYVVSAASAPGAETAAVGRAPEPLVGQVFQDGPASVAASVAIDAASLAGAASASIVAALASAQVAPVGTATALPVGILEAQAMAVDPALVQVDQRTEPAGAAAVAVDVQSSIGPVSIGCSAATASVSAAAISVERVATPGLGLVVLADRAAFTAIVMFDLASYVVVGNTLLQAGRIRTGAIMSNYSVGQTVRLTASFTDSADVPIDPTTVLLKVKEPSGMEVQYDAVIRTAVGKYRYDLPVTAAGMWAIRWVGAGACAAAAEQAFKVFPSKFATP